MIGYINMVLRRYLGDDEKLFSFHFAALKPISQDLTDGRFVEVSECCIDMALATFQGALHSFFHIFGRRL